MKECNITLSDIIESIDDYVIKEGIIPGKMYVDVATAVRMSNLRVIDVLPCKLKGVPFNISVIFCSNREGYRMYGFKQVTFC